MGKNETYAHTKEGQPPKNWQLLNDHLQRVANMAATFAGEFDSANWACVAGTLHDLGKESNEFQGYLRNANDITDELTKVFKAYGRRTVDHATAGAQVAVEQFGDKLGKLLAYVIAGHHAGLPNGKDNSESSLYSRLKKEIPKFAEPEAMETPEIPPMQPQKGFDIAFFVRMLYSCLVDADFLDTEEFMSPEKGGDRRTDMELCQLQTKLEAYTDQFEPKSSPINGRRAEILQSCLDAAGNEPGFFSLTVPTGGGKTISSLAFALKHAIKYGKKRIIYVIPYTSIIEQNAEVFRKILGDDAVLEHHSNFDPGKETRFSKLATENWDAPLIVTTNVQFFESLFANKSSRCRKLHNIAESVVILDEAQMLPVNLLHPCLGAMKALVQGYGTTMVLCTATQPALSMSDEFKNGIPSPQEIIADPTATYNAFKRVSVTVMPDVVDDAVLAEKLKSHQQVLCIVSNKRQARELFELISDCDGMFHLSTMMCPVHRTEILDEIRRRLKNGKPCRVISTQLIEAGVDVDFPVVFRAIAGIDSIAQAAGRCNREGKLERGDVFVFTPANPKNVPPGFLRHCADIGKQVLRHHEADVLSLDATHEYFRRLYWQSRESLDAKGISDALNNGAIKLDFPFKDVARDFTMIDSDTQSIIIPYGDKGQDLCDEIRKIYQFPDHTITRKAQRYTVQVHPFVFDNLRAAGVVESFVEEKFWILTNEDIYRHDVGLIPDDPTFYKVDTLMY